MTGLRCLPPPRPRSSANVAQCLSGLPGAAPAAGGWTRWIIPRAHLRRWLELVHSAVLLLDAPAGGRA